MSTQTFYDLIIIGAGPGGISMAVEAINSGISKDKILIIEKEQAHSWSIRKFYPENKPVTANFKGKPAVCYGVMCISDSSKEETLSYLDMAISNHKIEVHYNESVYKIEKHSDETLEGHFHIETSVYKYKTKVCILAIGIMGRPNKPSFPIPEELKSKVHHDLSFNSSAPEKILVVGGGDSASEYVQYLQSKENEVTISYRQQNFTRMNSINTESLMALIERKKVQAFLNSEIETLSEKDNQILVTFSKGEFKEILVDRIVLAIGGATPLNFLEAIGIKFDGKSPCLVEGHETSIPGLFLVGDLSAGKKGGSIISAFTSSHEAMRKICHDYLHCKVSRF